DGGYTEADAAQFSDFFESLFGGRGRRTTHAHRQFHMRGEDHTARVAVDLEDAYTGGQRAITLRAPEVTEDGHVILKER
ncbi:MAG: J domain-containing protein, partial [Gammaproteobacteria bacterium]|nr:J domain-containing protein [Gammaproteobacteria bacterium]NIV74244.1 J domain-containing protein [Gammaproteobacteria bacterium]